MLTLSTIRPTRIVRPWALVFRVKEKRLTFVPGPGLGFIVPDLMVPGRLAGFNQCVGAVAGINGG